MNMDKKVIWLDGTDSNLHNFLLLVYDRTEVVYIFWHNFSILSSGLLQESI